MSRRRALIAALGGAGLMLGFTAGAPSAIAAPVAAAHPPTGAAVQPRAAQGCNGDVCMYLATPSGGKDSAHAWLYSTTYFGRFRFQGPGLSEYSKYQTWYGGGANGTNYYPPTFSAVVGQYCFTFYWTQQTPPYNVIATEGRPCENIN